MGKETAIGWTDMVLNFMKDALKYDKVVLM